MVLTESNYETNRRGSIEVICGSMFSGKTEELIRRLKRAKIAPSESRDIQAGHRRALFRGEYRFA